MHVHATLLTYSLICYSALVNSTWTHSQAYWAIEWINSKFQ